MIASRTRSRLGRAVSAWPPAVRFAAALAAALAVVLATTGVIALVNSGWGFFDPVTIENPGTLYIASVTLVALLIGVGPALAASAASMLAVFLAFSRYESFERAVVLVATMLIIIGLAEWQRRAQDAAGRAQAKFEAILESMSDAVMVVDAAGRPTDVNNAAIAMLGAADRAAALAKVAHRRADGTPATDEYALLERALAGEETPQHDVAIPDGPDGPRIASAVASPMRDARGRIIGAVSVSRDMTDRLAQTRERESLLRRIERERQFSAHVLANVPVGIAVVRADDFTLLSFNAEYDDSVRHAPGSQPLTIGQSLLDALPAASRDAATRLLSRARDEQTTIRNTAYAAAVAPDRFYDGTIQPLQLGDGTPALLITAANVTERVRGEREREALLRQVEGQAAQLAATFEAMVDGIAVYDAEGNVLHRNEAFYRLLHLEPGNAPPQWDAFIRAMHMRRADGTPMGREETHSFRALHGETIREEIVLLRDGRGRERSMSQNASPIRAADGAVIGAVVVFNDVTERLAQEREREGLLTLLEERRRFAQAIFDAVPVSLAVVDTDAMVFSAANPAFIEATPASYHDLGVGGRALTSVLPHTVENGFVGQLRHTGRTGERFEASATRYAHPTRGVTYWNETMIPLATNDPAARHVLYIAADVTKEIEAQQRVSALAREAAERAGQLEAVFGALAEGLILTDARGNIVQANAAVGRILGLDGESLPSLDTFRERFAVRDQDGVPIAHEQRAAIAALHGATRADQLRRFRDAQGEERWMSVSTAPVRDEAGAITGVALTMRDVTEERRGIEERERLLREVERRERFAQAIFDSVPVGLMVVGADDGVIRTANDAYAHFIDERFAGADLVGRNAALLQPTGATTPLPENAEEQYLAGLRNVAAGGAAVTVREFAYPDYPGRGETFWDLTGVPHFAADGSINDILVVTVDTTEQTVNRRAMEALAKTAAQRAAEQEAIIANMPDGVALYGADGQLIQMNLAGQQISGEAHSPDDTLPAVVEHFDLRYPDGRVIPLDDLPLPRALRGETVSGYEFISHTRHGDRDIVASSAPIRDAAGEITSAVVVFSDITERKRAEGLTTRLGRILDASSNEIYVCDVVSLRFSQVNAGARRNLGYTMDELTHLTPLDIKPEFTLETYRALIAPLHSGERSEVVFETVHRRKDGSLYPVEVNLQLSQSETPPALVAIIQDITERRAAERQREQLLREIDERRRFVQTVVESAPVGIAAFGVDADLAVRMANGQYLQLLDEPWRGAGIMGHGMREFVPDADAAGLTALVRQVIEREEPLVLREFEFNGFARGPGYYDASIVPLREAGARVSGVLTVVADVTERVQSRQRIEELAWDAAQRASELETVIASIADGVLVTDAAGRIILENAASHRLTGRAASGVSLDLAAQVAEYALRAPDGAPLPPDALPLGRAVRGETVAEQVLILRRVDTGEDRFLMCSSAPVRAGSGAITGAVAVFRDITEMKQVEQMKDDFVSIAAHELRTPLTAIKGYAELLERRLSMQKGRESDRRSLDVIRKQSERLSNLVNEMLDVSRIEGGRLELNTEPFDLSALVGEVVNNMRVSSEAHTLSLAAVPGIVVDGDSARIEQVLLNLITNAITYSPEGGEIDVRVWKEDAAALVCVRDRGVGIALDELPHLFDRFYRAPRAGVMRAGGMGLGLYICREIVARHGGTIRAESAPGAGSTFTFSLPLAEN